jgi:hypothetical protein
MRHNLWRARTPVRLIVVGLLSSVLLVACPAATPPPSAAPTSARPPTVQPATPAERAATATPTEASPATNQPLAVLTFVAGEVWVEPGARPAQPLETLYAEAVVRTGATGRATFVCVDNRAVQVASGAAVPVTSATCQAGTPISDDGDGVRPGGRLAEIEGSLIVEEQVRRVAPDDFGRVPVLIGPLNTAVLGADALVIRWVAVPGALEYVLQLSGIARAVEVKLPAAEAQCAADKIAGHDVCSLGWPARWKLTEGKSHFLQIHARLKLAGPLRSSEPGTITLLGGEQAAAVRAQAERVRALRLDPLTEDVLLARLYTEHKLYGDAIAAYERALRVQPSPKLAVALGDTYEHVRLSRWALDAYQTALALLNRGGGDSADEVAVRAAAEFGLGQVAYGVARNRAEARKHFATAVQLYGQMGAAAELEAARKGLALTGGATP